jgi:hypothetical protein
MTLVQIKRIEPYEGFCTLGVHISPCGSNHCTLDILTTIVSDYSGKIISSFLTGAEALSAYKQYILPKLRYQPAVLSLRENECHKLLSLILMAILPKLHLNRHTARSIIYGPNELGGLDLPSLYTLQGIDKLPFFLGHLRIQDRTGDLIKIDLAYIQLLMGSGSFFLHLPYKKYTWIEWGWMTSLWEFLSHTPLTLQYTGQWLPTLPREKDLFIMDYFLSRKVSQKELRQLNACRLYLQAIFLSDVIDGGGTRILPEAKVGEPIPHRTSTLDWPIQGKPSSHEWSLWACELSILEAGGKLIRPLTSWLTSSHQEWQYRLDTSLNVLDKIHDHRVFKYTSIVRQGPCTCAWSQPWFDLTKGIEVFSLPTNNIPATVHQDNAGNSVCKFSYYLDNHPVKPSLLEAPMISHTEVWCDLPPIY